MNPPNYPARRLLAAMVVVCVAVWAASASAQWLTLPLAGTPRNADGTPNLAAPAPKTADGKADLSGIWRPRTSRALRGKPDIPALPWAQKLRDERTAALRKDDPEAQCLPSGVPEQMLTLPFKIVQTPGVTLVLYEVWANYRQIFTDGRTLPSQIQAPAWFGYSVGKWEGDALVVDSVGFNDRSWVLFTGFPRTEAMRITERFRRVTFGQLEIDFTFDDPGAYTKPWGATVQFGLMPDTEMLEHICENQKFYAPK
jgi:hypothetical protein